MNEYKRDLSDIKVIVVHNTQNYDMNARELYNWLTNKHSVASCHYLVDENETIQVTPLDEVAWNTGMAFDVGNMNGISVEICSRTNMSDYLKAEENAVKLIKELMEEYHLTKDDIFFHRDFCRDINCPANILAIYSNKQNFIDKYF